MFNNKYIYSFALLILLPFLLIYIIFISIKKDDFNFIKNRLGILNKINNTNNICIHCTSLGEVNGAKELIKEIIKNISNKYGLPNKYAEIFLNNILDILLHAFKANEEVKIKNFGTFKILKKSKRMGRNPKNNDSFQINSRNVVSFNASNYLKKKINSLEIAIKNIMEEQ